MGYYMSKTSIMDSIISQLDYDDNRETYFDGIIQVGDNKCIVWKVELSDFMEKRYRVECYDCTGNDLYDSYILDYELQKHRRKKLVMQSFKN